MLFLCKTYPTCTAHTTPNNSSYVFKRKHTNYIIETYFMFYLQFQRETCIVRQSKTIDQSNDIIMDAYMWIQYGMVRLFSRPARFHVH